MDCEQIYSPDDDGYAGLERGFESGTEQPLLPAGIAAYSLLTARQTSTARFVGWGAAVVQQGEEAWVLSLFFALFELRVQMNRSARASIETRQSSLAEVARRQE